MTHPLRDTAASQMLDEVPMVSPESKLAEVQSYILANIKRFETVNYIYLVDDKKRLAGVISIKDIYRHPQDTLAKKIAKSQRIISVKPFSDQEEVVHLALKNNLKAVPVVDEKNIFLGVVPSDKILSILYKEAREDILHLAGIHKTEAQLENILEISLWESFKHRIPWLLIGIAGGFFSAQIIGFFESTLERSLVLAAFIPLIVYISDAVGTQMEAFIIRDLAFQPKFSFPKYFIKQFSITLFIAFVCGIFLSFAVIFYYQNLTLALVLGLSLFIAVTSAIFTGLVIPFVLYKFKVDPASASGPIATIAQDIISVLVYFSIASRLL